MNQRKRTNSRNYRNNSSQQSHRDSFVFDDRLIGRRTNQVIMKKPQQRLDQFVYFQSEMTQDSISAEIPRLCNKEKPLLDDFQIDSDQLQINDKNKKRSSALWSYIENFPQNKMNSNFMLDINQNSQQEQNNDKTKEDTSGESRSLEISQRNMSENVLVHNYLEDHEIVKNCPTSKKDSKSQIQADQNDKQTNNSRIGNKIPPPIEQIQSKSSIQIPKKKLRFKKEKSNKIEEAEQVEETAKNRTELQFIPINIPQDTEKLQRMGQTGFRRRTRMQILKYWLRQRKQYKNGKLVGFWIQKGRDFHIQKSYRQQQYE